MAAMTRRIFLAQGATFLAAPFAAEAQGVGAVRIGYIAFNADNPSNAEFVAGLRELGYVEGRNVVIEYRWAGGDPKRLPALAADLVARNVNVIVAPGNLPTTVAAAATNSIPIVTIAVVNPVETRLVKSLARPGGNITGVTWEIGTDPVAKKFETFKQIVPTATRMAIVWNPTLPGLENYRAPAVNAAAQLALKLNFFEYGAEAEFEHALDAAVRQRPHGMFVVSEPTNWPRRRAICELALKAQVPTLANDGEWTRAGCLISYAVNVGDLFRRSARFVDKILKGAKPADLPLEQPRAFEVVINRQTAKALGLTIPPSLLLRADQIIE